MAQTKRPQGILDFHNRHRLRRFQSAPRCALPYRISPTFGRPHARPSGFRYRPRKAATVPLKRQRARSSPRSVVFGRDHMHAPPLCQSREWPRRRHTSDFWP
jgi:hypothetical protein